MLKDIEVAALYTPQEEPRGCLVGALFGGYQLINWISFLSLGISLRGFRI